MSSFNDIGVFLNDDFQICQGLGSFNINKVVMILLQMLFSRLLRMLSLNHIDGWYVPIECFKLFKVGGGGGSS